MREFMAEAAGATLAVRESRPDGEPLLLHRGPGMTDGMQTSIAPLPPEFRSISFDQRGTGGSTRTDGRFDIAAYLAAIDPIRQALAIPS